jgi:hypothetical protein
MSRKMLPPRLAEGRFPRHPAPVSYESCLLLVSWPMKLGCCTSSLQLHLHGSDDAEWFLKPGKRGGCSVSTMVLSEARGLVLFRVIRGGIGFTQRLGVDWAPCAYRVSSYSPSNPSVSKNRLATTAADQRRRRGLFTRDAQAACDFSFSASKPSPFFHSVSVMAAILRARVRRAMVGLMPLASNLW